MAGVEQRRSEEPDPAERVERVAGGRAARARHVREQLPGEMTVPLEERVDGDEKRPAADSNRHQRTFPREKVLVAEIPVTCPLAEHPAPNPDRFRCFQLTLFSSPVA